MRQKSTIVDVPIFQAEFLLVYFKDYKYANKILEKYKFTDKINPQDGGMVNSEVIQKDNGDCSTKFYLLVAHSDDYTILKNIIAHESLHLTQEILENRGINFKKRDANETYTYFNSWLQNEIESFIIE